MIYMISGSLQWCSENSVEKTTLV